MIKLAKMGNFIYNILSERLLPQGKSAQRGENMFHFNNNKNKRIFSVIIVALLVLAMIVPTIASFMY